MRNEACLAGLVWWSGFGGVCDGRDGKQDHRGGAAPADKLISQCRSDPSRQSLCLTDPSRSPVGLHELQPQLYYIQYYLAISVVPTN